MLQKELVQNASAPNSKSKHYLMHSKCCFYLSLIAIDHHGLRYRWHLIGYETLGIVQVNILSKGVE